jgi:tRNA pseudouridine38-40 synthase
MALLAGRIAVVTGGAQGLGYAIAEQFIAEGARVILGDLDLDRMRRAARSLLGRHDFLALSASPGYERQHTIRNLSRCEIRRSGPLLTFIIEADGFLYRMCRGIVGTLVQVGNGKIPTTELTPLLASRDRCLTGMTAPAQGLVLQKVYYPPRA